MRTSGRVPKHAPPHPPLATSACAMTSVEAARQARIQQVLDEEDHACAERKRRELREAADRIDRDTHQYLLDRRCVAARGEAALRRVRERIGELKLGVPIDRRTMSYYRWVTNTAHREEAARPWPQSSPSSARRLKAKLAAIFER